MPKELTRVAQRVFEMEPEADRDYYGSLPGTVTITGYSREFAFWHAMETDQGQRPTKGWLRNWSPESVNSTTIYTRWKAINGGLGPNWTERQGYEDLRQYIGKTRQVLL